MHTHLPETLQRRVCEFLDLRSVLRLRRCSSHYLELVTNDLTETFEASLSAFVPYPTDLMRNLISCDAYVGGDVALHYLLREPFNANAMEAHLDVYVPEGQFDWFVQHLETEQAGVLGDFPAPPGENVDEWLEHHALVEVAVVETSVGLVYLHRAQGEDALAPVARSWSTLHICYANGVLLGCGFPTLLFDRRGLIGDMSTEEEDLRLCQEYMRRGFDLRLSASSWDDFGGTPDGPMRCCADSWCCHAQPRTFEDRGALRCQAVLGMDKAYVADTWVTWRLDIRPCGGDCLKDGVLEGWQVIDVQ